MKGRAGNGIAFFSALAGGAGVALAAVAAHKVESQALVAAANMLMVHGAAGMALVALASGQKRSCLWLAAAALVVGGSLLFATAVALPLLTQVTFVKGAAPVGGTTVIVGWALALLAAARRALYSGDADDAGRR